MHLLYLQEPLILRRRGRTGVAQRPFAAATVLQKEEFAFAILVHVNTSCWVAD